jgi:hypothetical protein
MILIGSALLLAIGLLILLVQALRIAFSLLKIAFYLLKGAVYLAVLVVCAVGLGVQSAIRRLKPEPVVNFYSDDKDVPTIELPRDGFRRVRG